MGAQGGLLTTDSGDARKQNRSSYPSPGQLVQIPAPRPHPDQLNQCPGGGAGASGYLGAPGGVGGSSIQLKFNAANAGRESAGWGGCLLLGSSANRSWQLL